VARDRDDALIVDRLILASASADVAELLRAAGFRFDAVPVDVHGEIDAEETPDGFVRRIALTRVDAVLPQANGRPVLAAEAALVADGRILGRPASAGAASEMLRRLAGREHVVITAVCLAWYADETRQIRTRVERTTIEIGAMTEAEIDWYVQSGEPLQRVGAYAMQGLGSRFVTRVAGSYSNALGLPVAAVYELCVAAELKVF
jgi:nucleoside triphosphate pyrophosphatase